ncbi:prepilin peptidase [Pseudarthrobacter siccitolerans]|nr:prepilin peptidase [Pseudarthrobacter siccitolerans]
MVDDGSGWLFVIGAALLGLILSPASEALIAKHLPRLGAVPTLPVRITTAALTFAICFAFALRLGISSQLPAFIFLAVIGVQLARTDIALHLLPNPLVLATLLGGFLLLLLPAISDSQMGNLLRGMIAAVILFAAYLALALISPGAIGMGDVKLAAPIGLYLGYLGWTPLLYGGLLGFILNGLVTLTLVALKGRNKGAEVPHGPSMLAATAVITLFLT